MSTPYAAPIDSRFITAALSGTTTERNTIASSSTETPTTNAMTSGSRSASIAEMSAKSGDVTGEQRALGQLVAHARRPAPASARRWPANAGCTSITATAPSGETTGSLTATTSARSLEARRSRPTVGVVDLGPVGHDDHRGVGARRRTRR